MLQELAHRIVLYSTTKPQAGGLALNGNRQEVSQYSSNLIWALKYAQVLGCGWTWAIGQAGIMKPIGIHRVLIPVCPITNVHTRVISYIFLIPVWLDTSCPIFVLECHTHTHTIEVFVRHVSHPHASPKGIDLIRAASELHGYRRPPCPWK